MTKAQKESFNKTLSVFLQETQGKFTTAQMIELLTKLHRYETTLSRYAEIETRRGLTQAEEVKGKRILTKVNEIAQTLGFGFRYNSDPRGYAICFILPSRTYNNWDAETWRLNW